ncbi:MAG: hypothetical protein KAS11_01775 [Candidatus Aenigmarchaeota archaeon]|nr:hypothetical protein [Candidatus Aenigmarchaeota archaeon]
MKPEIQKLKTEFIHQRVEVAEHVHKMQDILDKTVNLFREDRSITFEDFKDAKILVDKKSGFELAKLTQSDMPNVKELMIEYILKNFNPGHNINFSLIKEYFEHKGDTGSVDNITLFERDFNEILEYRLRDVIDFIKNHLGEDSQEFFRDFYGKDKK